MDIAIDGCSAVVKMICELSTTTSEGCAGSSYLISAGVAGMISANWATIADADLPKPSSRSRKGAGIIAEYLSHGLNLSRPEVNVQLGQVVQMCKVGKHCANKI